MSKLYDKRGMLTGKKYYWRVNNKNYQSKKVNYLNVLNKEQWTISNKAEDAYWLSKYSIEEYEKMIEDGFIEDILKKEEIK